MDVINFLKKTAETQTVKQEESELHSNGDGAIAEEQSGGEKDGESTPPMMKATSHSPIAVARAPSSESFCSSCKVRFLSMASIFHSNLNKKTHSSV